MTTSSNNTITSVDNAVLDYSNTGNGRKYCHDCGKEFVTDNQYVVVGRSTGASCHDCGGRCANPEVVGVKEVITGTWIHEDRIGDFFVSDSGEEFTYNGTDKDGDVFFKGNKDRKFLVGVGELLDWNKAVKVNSMSGALDIGRFVYSDGDFAYLQPSSTKYRWTGIVVMEEEHEVYKRYTIIPIE